MLKFKKNSIFEGQFNFQLLLETETPLNTDTQLYKDTREGLNSLTNLQITIDNFIIDSNDNTAKLNGNVQNELFFYYKFGESDNVIIKTPESGLVLNSIYVEVIQKLLAYYMTFADKVKENFNFIKQ